MFAIDQHDKDETQAGLEVVVMAMAQCEREISVSLKERTQREALAALIGPV